MDKSAIYHRSTDQYCYPIDTDNIVIQLQTGKDIARVILVCGDPFDGGILGGDWQWKGEEKEIPVCTELENHLLWSITIAPPYKRLRYYFRVLDAAENEYIVLEEGIFPFAEYQQKTSPDRAFNYAWLNENDIIQVPQWVKDTRWYQIFPERFCNANDTLNPAGVLPWTESEAVSNEQFYGGDIAGIISKLDYIKDLGINGIYLTPVFEASTSHKYDTNNYFKLDPQFGSEEDLKTLVSEAHKRDIRIMIDAVFNHCGPQFEPWLDVLQNREQSIYKDWFMIHDFDKLDDLKSSTHDSRFYTFAFTPDMPKLNTNHPQVQEFLLEVSMYWVKNCDIDAWRLDVANEVCSDFWRLMRKELKALKPDIYILGEVWMDSINWLRGDQFDSVMNYPLTGAISHFFTEKKQTTQQFAYKINACYSLYSQQINSVLFNLLDSHDTQRLYTASENEDSFWQQLVILYTMTGSPSIFYGTETLMAGKHDPFCRRCMPWESLQQGKFDDSLQEMKKILALRKNYNDIFNEGKLTWACQEEKPRLLAYTKKYHQQTISVFINASDQAEKTNPDGRVIYSRSFQNNNLGIGGIVIYLTDEEL